MIKHTPGPWIVGPSNNCYRSISADGWAAFADVCVEMISGSVRFKKPEGEANAHLIAAAPEMYEALECVLHELRNFDGVSERTERRVESALAKAEGRS